MIALALALALAQQTQFQKFDAAIAQAADALGVPVPIVRLIELSDAPNALVAAYVTPPMHGEDGPWMVTAVAFHLDYASDRRIRCWARHEMLHVWQKHRGGTKLQRDRHHDVVRYFQMVIWREDSSCMAD